jgi:outer membrane immunogenic protein
MKKTIIWAAFALIAAAGAAQAADLNRGYYKAPAAYAPPPVYSWMGPYIGLNLGYQWGDVTHNPAEPSGFAGGLQIGHNWQMGQFVYGLETDIQLSGADDKFAGWKFSNPWFGTARARAGVALNNILLYVTGGLAYGRVEGEFLGFSESKTHFGYTIGGGMEVGLTPNWSAKAEYLWIDLGDRGYALTGQNNGFESSLLRFGVNYRF